jgi:HEAT repeat protein
MKQLISKLYCQDKLIATLTFAILFTAFNPPTLAQNMSGFSLYQQDCSQVSFEIGDQGDCVRALQIQLNNWGFPLRLTEPLEVTGTYDLATQNALGQLRYLFNINYYNDEILNQAIWASNFSGLIQLLEHEEAEVRIGVSRAIGSLGARPSAWVGSKESGYDFGVADICSKPMIAAILPLVALLNDEDPRVVGSAANALSNISSKAVPALANPTLIKLLEHEKTEIRKIAAETLGAIGPDAASVAVGPLIRSLEDPSMREKALQALQDMGTAAIPPLVRYLDDDNPIVRRYVAESLGNLGFIAQAAVEPLTYRLEDENPYVRGAARNALKSIQFEPAMDQLLQAIREEELSEIQDRYVDDFITLTYLFRESSIDAMIKLLEEEDSPEVILAVTMALGNIGPEAKAAAEKLANLLETRPTHNQDDPHVVYVHRFAAIEALGKIGSGAEVAVEPLIDLLKTRPDNGSDYSLQRVAIETLGNIGPGAEAAVEPLIDLLKTRPDNGSDYSLQDVAIQALGDIGPEAMASAKSILRIFEESKCNNSSSWFSENTSLCISAAKALIQIIPNSEFALNFDYLKQFFDNSDDIDELFETYLDLLKILKIDPSLTSDIDSFSSFLIMQALNVKEENFYGNYDSGAGSGRKLFSIDLAILHSLPPNLIHSLLDILENKDYNFKARYAAAFILGYIEPKDVIIESLMEVVNSPDEDFDIRWIVASSLSRLGQNMDYFFDMFNLVNPVVTICPIEKMLDPYTGYCESKESAGAGGRGWRTYFGNLYNRNGNKNE